MENLTKLLSGSNIKHVSRMTGISYYKLYRWNKGFCEPEMNDYKILIEYFKVKIELANENKMIVEQLSGSEILFGKDHAMRALIAEKDKRLAEMNELVKAMTERIAGFWRSLSLC